MKVSINNFQSFMMSLVRDIFSDAHSENCYYNKAPQKETELTFYIQCVIANIMLDELKSVASHLTLRRIEHVCP